MSRYSERQNAMIAVYIHLVNGQSLEEIIEDNKFVSNVGEFIQPFNLGEEMLEVIHHSVERRDTYERAMDQLLTGWRFNRLGYLEQAILLVACAELELGIQNRVIVVNEAIRLAKEYCDFESFKLINGVLDAL